MTAIFTEESYNDIKKDVVEHGSSLYMMDPFSIQPNMLKMKM